MAKNKNKAVETEIVTPDVPKSDKKQAKNKTNNKPKKKEKSPSKIVTKTKETISELKKVSWPSFKTVMKNTGIVISVVVIFAVVLFGVDYLLSLLHGLL